MARSSAPNPDVWRWAIRGFGGAVALLRELERDGGPPLESLHVKQLEDYLDEANQIAARLRDQLRQPEA